jgi:hypothetical protein
MFYQGVVFVGEDLVKYMEVAFYAMLAANSGFLE